MSGVMEQLVLENPRTIATVHVHQDLVYRASMLIGMLLKALILVLMLFDLTSFSLLQALHSFNVI